VLRKDSFDFHLGQNAIKWVVKLSAGFTSSPRMRMKLKFGAMFVMSLDQGGSLCARNCLLKGEGLFPRV
jgi:hypothetical protein